MKLTTLIREEEATIPAVRSPPPLSRALQHASFRRCLDERAYALRLLNHTTSLPEERLRWRLAAPAVISTCNPVGLGSRNYLDLTSFLFQGCAVYRVMSHSTRPGP